TVQREALVAEKLPERPDVTSVDLVRAYRERVERALDELRTIDESRLLDARGVGRMQLPSNVLGILFHVAEHVMRHTGQLLVTVRVQKGQV
ncbi:MAG TPA: DinB family protein, partial [Burkholderiales bacterium]